MPSGFGRFPSALFSSETTLLIATMVVGLAAALVLLVPLEQNETRTHKINRAAVGRRVEQVCLLLHVIMLSLIHI